MRLPLLFTFLCTTAVCTAQSGRVKQYTAPLAGTVVLRDVEDKYNATVYNLAMPEPDAEEENERLDEIKEQVSERYRRAGSSAYKTTAGSSYSTPVSSQFLPLVETSFIADSMPGIPPDNDMAISKGGMAVSVMNSSIAITDINAGKMLYRKGLRVFSNTAGLNGLGDTRYDPKIMYDQEADKFICIMLNSTDGGNYIVVGFSKTNDPAGTWNFYKFYGNYGNDTTWFDYPSIAMTKDEFFFTGNKIHFATSWQLGFKQSLIYQLRKQDGYDGAAAINYQIWDSISYNGKTIRNLYPVKAATTLNTGAQYFLSNRNFDVQNDTIFLIKMPDVLGSNNNNLTVTPIKSPVAYGVPPNGRQPDTSLVLQTNDGRILGAYAEDNEIQFVSASVHPVNGASAVYHARISNYKATPRIDHAKFYTIDTLDFGYPNITYAGNGKMGSQSFISFNYTGPKTYAGLGVILFDGSEYSAMVKVKTGDSNIRALSAKEQRWGDYMGAQPDYNNKGSVWIEGIYGRKDRNYGNWMAKITSPLAQVTKTHDVLFYPNPAFQYIQFEFDVEKEQLYSFVIYNIAGQVVDKILQQHCDEGRNRLQFNVGALATGTYYMKVVNEKGKTDFTNKFIKY